MSEPRGMFLDLSVSDAMPLPTLYREREEARLDEQQQLTIGIDASEEGLATAADTVAEKGGRKGLASPQESTSEVVRDKAMAEFNAGPVRKGADAVLRTLTGLGLEDIEAAVRNGTLPDAVSLKLLDPAGSVSEALVRKTAEDSGLDADTAGKIATGTGLLLGMLLPPGGIKGKGAAKVAKAPGEGINLARVGATDAVKSTMKAINDLQAERLAGARKTVTHGQTIEAGRRLGLTLEQAATLDVAKYEIAPVQNALRDYHNAAARHVDDLFRRTLKGDEDAAVELNHAFTVSGDLSVRDELLGKALGRGLEARKIASDAQRAPFSSEQIVNLSDLMGGASADATREDLVRRGVLLAKRLDGLSKDARRQFEHHAVAAARAGKTNVLYEAWLNWGLLSGPQTHFINMLSNTGTSLWAPGERLLAAVWDTALSGRGGWGDRSVYLGESAAMLYGMTTAMRQAVILAGKALRTGSSEFGPDKVEFGADAARRVLTQGDNAAGAAIGFWGAIFRAPTRALTAEDAFFKTINYQAELYAQAYREAATEGLTGKAFAAKVRKVVNAPPSIVDERARQFALTQTFTRSVDDLGWVGEAGGKLLGGVRAIPFLGPLAAPFMRTPINIMHYAVERTPILNAASDTLRRELMGTSAQRAEALGKITAGALVGWGVMEYAAHGLMTGGGPKNYQERLMWEAQDGRKPYSIRIGDQWVSYNRLDPIGTMMGTVADAMDIMSRLPQSSPYNIEIATAIGVALSRNMVSKTYLEGIASLFETFTDPGRNLLDMPKDIARTTVPSFLRTVERTTTDPAIRERRVPRERFNETTGTFDNDPWSEINELLNEVRANIPGLSDELPPMRNRWGEVVLTTPGVGPDILSPIYSSVVKDDPVAREVARLRIGLSKPRPVVFGGSPPQMALGGPEEEHGVELNDVEYDRLLVLAGQGGQAPEPGGLAGLPTFREALATAMRNEEYRTAGDGGKRLIVRKIDDRYKKAARAQVMDEYPGLVDLIRFKLQNRADSIKPSQPGTIGPGLTIQGR